MRYDAVECCFIAYLKRSSITKTSPKCDLISTHEALRAEDGEVTFKRMTETP